MTLKQTLIRTLSKFPAYKAMPPSASRIYAAVKYHQRRATDTETADLIGGLDRIPTGNRRTALLAARAVFRAGGDDLVDDALSELERTAPQMAGAHRLRAEYRAFRGEHRLAYEAAERAVRIDPNDGAATARMIENAYWILDGDEADLLAVEEVGRLPESRPVLWAAAKRCTDTGQLERLLAAWRDAGDAPGRLHRAVAQLATAAARAGAPAAGVELYREAIRSAAVDLSVLPRPASGVTLAGKSAWKAVLDLRRAFDEVGVPYFFAAGTALGFVRQDGPLSADGDIDLGVFDGDFDRERLVEHFDADSAFELDLHPRSRKIGLRHRAGAPIDIFPFYRDGDHVYHDGVFVRWRNSPFAVEQRLVRGVELPVPVPVDEYLTENYGDWRTPNSDFDAFTDDAPNVEVTWKDYLRLHHMRRAYTALSAGERDAATADLSAAGETGLL